MRTVRLLVPAAVGVVALAGCTSFTEGAAGGPASSSSATGTSATATTAPSGGPELSVADRRDLPVAASAVTGARVVTAEGAGRAGGTSAVLLTGPTSSVLTVDGSATERSDVVDLAATDLVLVDGAPVVVGLTADPVSRDPVLALGAAGADPVPLDPPRTTRRGTPVLAAAGDGVVHLLVEDADAVVTRVLAVDPTTGRVRSDVVLDVGGAPTSVDLVGLVATDDGGLLAGLDVRAADGTSTGRLVTLDDDLRQTGDPEVLDAPLLALTAAGDPVTADALGSAVPDARVSGAAPAGDALVVAVLDQASPTVLVLDGAGEPTLLELCDDEGDALAVAAADGSVVVAGTCDGDAQLWTLR